MQIKCIWIQITDWLINLPSGIYKFCVYDCRCERCRTDTSSTASSSSHQATRYPHHHPFVRRSIKECTWISGSFLYPVSILPETGYANRITGFLKGRISGDIPVCNLVFRNMWPAVLRIRIRTYPHLKRPPAWTDADPDPGGKKALKMYRLIWWIQNWKIKGNDPFVILFNFF